MKHRQTDPPPALSPDFPTTEYRLVLRPNESLWDEIRAIQDSFALRYEAPGQVKTRPFIPLVRFSGFNMAQGKLIRELRRLLSREYPFPVTLEGFGSLPTHTLFIPVSSRNSIRDLESSLGRLKPLMGMEGKKPHFIQEPFLVIAQKLGPGTYEKAWMEMENAPFRGVFIADRLLLLHRPSEKIKPGFSLLADLPLEGKSPVESGLHSLFEKIP